MLVVGFWLLVVGYWLLVVVVIVAVAVVALVALVALAAGRCALLRYFFFFGCWLSLVVVFRWLLLWAVVIGRHYRLFFLIAVIRD